MRTVFSFTLILLLVLASDVMAESIDGRLGLTGKLGVYVPVQNDFITSTSDAKAGFAGGGSLIYGLNNSLAVELDITHVPTIDVEAAGVKVGEAALTDLSLGLQYRFTPQSRLVPFLGAGVDFINGDFKNEFDQKYDLDWSVGGHVNAGVDYFVTRSIALSVEAKGIFAGKGDMKKTALQYDPTSFVGTVGIRLFLPDKLVD